VAQPLPCHRYIVRVSHSYTRKPPSNRWSLPTRNTSLPKKLAAVAAKSELFKISEYKSMSLDFHDLSLADGVSSPRTSFRHYTLKYDWSNTNTRLPARSIVTPQKYLTYGNTNYVIYGDQVRKMESELRGVIDDLTTFADGQEAITAAQKCLNRLKMDKKHFSRVYAAICAKIFQLTCNLPYQEVSKLVSMAPPDDVIVTLCTCITSSRYGSNVVGCL